MFKAGELEINETQHLISEGAQREGVVCAHDVEIACWELATVLIQQETFYGLHADVVHHCLFARDGEPQSQGVDAHHSVVGPALLAPEQELQGHLIPVQHITIVDAVKRETLASEILTIAQQEIYHTGTIPEYETIGYLRGAVDVGSGHTHTGSACCESPELPVEKAVLDHEVRLCGAITKHSITTRHVLYDHCAVTGSRERLIFVQH